MRFVIALILIFAWIGLAIFTGFFGLPVWFVWLTIFLVMNSIIDLIEMIGKKLNARRKAKVSRRCK